MTTPSPLANHSRNRSLLIFGGFLLLVAIGAICWWYIWGQYEAGTDDAYVQGNKADVYPRVPGVVKAIYTDDTYAVNEGQLLLEIEDTDYKLQFEAAKANLAETIRQVRQLFENVASSKNQYLEQKALLEASQFNFFQRKSIQHTGSISEEEFVYNQSRFQSQMALTDSAFHHYLSMKSLIEHTDIRHHPLVMQAVENLKKHFLALQRCSIRAPVTGLIAQRTAQVGEKIDPSRALMSIIPMEQIWVEANLKEVDLTHVRIGQKATVRADLYGDSVTYYGWVEGIGAGTGAVFAVLPPQNATGNWIKIVQRVPVRIQLKQEDLSRYPLRLGLSLDVSIDTHDRAGPVLPASRPAKPFYQTAIYQDELKGVENDIEKIFQENLPPLLSDP